MTLTLSNSAPLDRSAAQADPEVWREYLALRRGERARDAAARKDAADLSGVGDIVPEVFRPTPLDLLMACARRRVRERRARRDAPEGRYASALAEIGRILRAATLAFEEARAAHARCFTSERRRCAEKAATLAGLADNLKTAALDADLATEG